ncbi:hypothetical protein V6N13_008975 [Hibiscus sabdariffa]|uniref:Protein kinase domain-containing protein n=1 Tax=Hibiscus sabdariffa TaxID=183260 RepID=A0ABR2NRA6_9ROSI
MGILVVFYFTLQLPWLLHSHSHSESKSAATLNSWFRVTCNETANGQKPFISSINLELLGKFRPYDKLVAVKNPVTYLNCGSEGNNGSISAASVNLTGSPFFFSSRYNRFESVGCGNLVFVSRNIQTDPVLGSCLQRRCGGLTSKLGGCHDGLIKENMTCYTDLDPHFPYDITIATTQVPATLEWNPIQCNLEDVFNRFVSFGCGCATFLSNSTDDTPDGYCLQPRCGNNVAPELSCSSGIPPGLSSLAVTVTPIYPSIGNSSSCGSAFVVDERYIDSVDKMIPNRNDTKNWTLFHVPTTLQWGTQKRGLCELREGSNIFCRSDSEYCWTSLSQTHLCVCTSDPYVDSNDVCQESGKCQDLKYKHCYMLCLNTPGHNCSSSCPVGYEYEKDMCKPKSPSTGTKEPKSSKNLPIIVGCCTSIGTIFVLLGTWRLYKLLAKRNNVKRRQKYFKKNGGLLLQQRLSNNEGNVEKIKLFASKELEKATDYYNENRVLGRGGQGIVYKGILTDGSIVAVKSSKSVGEKHLTRQNLNISLLRTKTRLVKSVRGSGEKLGKLFSTINGGEFLTGHCGYNDVMINASNVASRSASSMIESSSIASCSASGSILNDSVTFSLDA